MTIDDYMAIFTEKGQIAMRAELLDEVGGDTIKYVASLSFTTMWAQLGGDWSELLEWCNVNIEGNYCKLRYSYYGFELANDAALFRLTWG